MKAAATILAAVLLAAATSCMGPTWTERKTQEYQLHTPESYKLGVGDVLEVTIITANERGVLESNKELVRNCRVLRDGTIDYLFNDVTGELLVVGKTAPEVAKMLQAQLVEKNKIYTGARVSAIVVSSASNVYYVAGEVKSPGIFMLEQPTTIMQALVRAGWFTEFADKKHIQVIRRDGDKEIRINFNFSDYIKHGRSTKYADIMLQPNDTVFVSD
jgi:polysaccharide export outer membrane protein